MCCYLLCIFGRRYQTRHYYNTLLSYAIQSVCMCLFCVRTNYSLFCSLRRPTNKTIKKNHPQNVCEHINFESVKFSTMMVLYAMYRFTHVFALLITKRTVHTTDKAHISNWFMCIYIIWQCHSVARSYVWHGTCAWAQTAQCERAHFNWFDLIGGSAYPVAQTHSYVDIHYTHTHIPWNQNGFVSIRRKPSRVKYDCCLRNFHSMTILVLWYCFVFVCWLAVFIYLR